MAVRSTDILQVATPELRQSWGWLTMTGQITAPGKALSTGRARIRLGRLAAGHGNLCVLDAVRRQNKSRSQVGGERGRQAGQHEAVAAVGCRAQVGDVQRRVVHSGGRAKGGRREARMVGAVRRVGTVQRVVRRVRLHGQGLHSRKRNGREELGLLLLVLLLLVMLLELMLLVMLLELNVRQGHGVLLTLLVQQIIDPHNLARCRRFHIVLTGWDVVGNRGRRECRCEAKAEAGDVVLRSKDERACRPRG